jgi:hypothetical protein
VKLVWFRELQDDKGGQNVYKKVKELGYWFRTRVDPVVTAGMVVDFLANADCALSLTEGFGGCVRH